ncbi:hypothetical protein LXM94_18915, partial [Rhizobium sp. TRM95111]|nr:hypothetical protein [Rhizobium alarense]
MGTVESAALIRPAAGRALAAAAMGRGDRGPAIDPRRCVGGKGGRRAAAGTGRTLAGRVGESGTTRAGECCLGSGLIDQSQKMTVAAMHIAEKKVCA